MFRTVRLVFGRCGIGRANEHVHTHTNTLAIRLYKIIVVVVATAAATLVGLATTAFAKLFDKIELSLHRVCR